MEMTLKVPNPWEGARVFMKERTASTMDDALSLAKKGYPSGTALVAGYQERGRGRVPGRAWVSSPWESLLVSVVLEPREVGFPLSLLPLSSAVAVCRAVDPWLSRPAGVKWPNDVLFQGRKLGGILCESRGGFLIIGIGINCNQASFPHELADIACSLRQASGREVPPLEPCARLLAELKRVLSDGGWMGELERRLCLRGHAVSVQAPGSGETVRGVLEGVDRDGALLVVVEGGARRRIAQGEIRESR
jgi:BirA family biotin operon repressor/biotin-[acetyl-CoA-carboxylase] ligase